MGEMVCPFPKEPEEGFLKKPFTPLNLGGVLQEVLRPSYNCFEEFPNTVPCECCSYRTSLLMGIVCRCIQPISLKSLKENPFFLHFRNVYRKTIHSNYGKDKKSRKMTFPEKSKFYNALFSRSEKPPKRPSGKLKLHMHQCLAKIKSHKSHQKFAGLLYEKHKRGTMLDAKITNLLNQIKKFIRKSNSEPHQ